MINMYTSADIGCSVISLLPASWYTFSCMPNASSAEHDVMHAAATDTKSQLPLSGTYPGTMSMFTEAILHRIYVADNAWILDQPEVKHALHQLHQIVCCRHIYVTCTCCAMTGNDVQHSRYYYGTTTCSIVNNTCMHASCEQA